MPSKQLEHVAIPEIPFHELVLTTAWQHHCEEPTKKAFITAEDADDYVTFGDVYRITHSVAGFLKDIGLTKGDVCLISLPNCWQFATIFLAVGANGGATTGINEDSTWYETQRQLDDSTASVVFTNSYCLRKFVKASEKCKNLRAMVVLDELRGPAPATTFRLYRWKDVVAREPSFDRRSVRIDPKNDVLGLPYSSGTTGQPKGVMITHYNYTAQMTISKAHFERHIMPFGGYDPKESQYTVHFLPLYHAYGFFSMNASLLFGSTVVIIRRYTPQLLLACIEKYKAARVSMVPGLLAFLAKSPMVDKYDLSSMRQVGNGGGPLSRELAEAVLKRLPHLKHVAQGYGMTEMTTGMHASVLSEGNVALGSVGKIYPNCEQKIIDPDTGKECAIGEEGELYVRGPNVMKGYWRNEKATREVLSPDGWLRTGDIVVEDERGLLYIRDRNKELIKVNAFQVAPTELEALLMTHHGVLDAAVVGIPHPSKGEVPRAYVVRRTENLTEKQIADFVADRVSHYKRLVGGVEFIREIPRNPTGKVLRRQLKEEFLKRSTNGNGRSKL